MGADQFVDGVAAALGCRTGADYLASLSTVPQSMILTESCCVYSDVASKYRRCTRGLLWREACFVSGNVAAQCASCFVPTTPPHVREASNAFSVRAQSRIPNRIPDRVGHLDMLSPEMRWGLNPTTAHHASRLRPSCSLYGRLGRDAGIAAGFSPSTTGYWARLGGQAMRYGAAAAAVVRRQ